MTAVPKLVFGAANIGTGYDSNGVQEVFSILNKYDVKEIDTAYIYPNSEETLKSHDAASKFIIDSKAPGFSPGALSKQKVLDGLKQTLQRLGVSKIRTYYLHAPDTETPIEETLEAITQLHKEGAFEAFGLSNFKVQDVQKIYDIQKSNNAVLPTVFQGNYNAVSRHIETELFPVLRKLKIAFYAYSPIAGGFLVKSSKTLREGAGEGRFSNDSPVGKLYNSLYGKESLFAALDEWEKIAKKEGISKAALAYRWIAYHSALKASEGDGIILGASKTSQLEESLAAIGQGPLSDDSVALIEDVWKKVEHEAPLDNYHQ